MRNTGKTIFYPEINTAEGSVCSLCGKQGGINFKNTAVCEDCLEYVKTNF